jgi:hypothetical protein
MSAQHASSSVKSRAEKLELWVGQRHPESRRAPRPAQDATPGPATSMQTNGPSASRSPGDEASPTANTRDVVDLAILLRTLGASSKEVRQTLRQIAQVQSEAQTQGLTVEITIQRNAAQPEQASQGWGLAYDLHEETVQTESTSFQAAGTVTTADGRSLEFATVQSQERVDAQATSLSVRAGDAEKIDPLVLNLSGAPVSFSGSQAFDLNTDGKLETVARLDAGHAYLAMDRNGNGTIDNGSELFGPTTGSGFGELTAQDADGNGWIDEADAGFGQLQLWSPGTVDGGSLQSLGEAGVGAIAVQNVSTPFTVTAAGRAQAVIAQTGIYLRENGQVGTVQHIDLTV